MDGIQISWFDPEQTILRVHFASAYTWDDYDMATQKMDEMTLERNCRIDSISTAAPKVGVPPGNAIAHYRKSAARLPANVGFIVLVTAVGRYKLVKIVYVSVMRVLGVSNKMRMAGSVEEAHQLILHARQLDAALLKDNLTEMGTP